MKNMSWRERIIGCGVIILFLAMGAVLCRAFVTNVVIPKWKINNAVTDFIMEKPEKARPYHKLVSVKWDKLYPFKDSKKAAAAKNKKNTVIQFKERITGLEQKITTKEKAISNYSNEKLWGFQDWVEMKMAYEKWIGWDICGYIRWIGKDYLVNRSLNRIDKRRKIQSVTEFYNFCKEQGIPFLFVQTPYKVSQNIEQDRFPILGNTNAQADALIQGLEANNIPVLDIRDEVEKEKLAHYNLFFKTDHHWKPQTAMWAAERITKNLQARPDINLQYDSFLLTPEAYKEVVYQRNFLGSQGRKVTLARADPEDISLFYPKTETDFAYIIPSRKIHLRGDFSVMYDMNQIREGDYYYKNSYAAYSYGDQALIQIRNYKVGVNGKHVLMIKDSFGDAVEPFLAMTVAQLDVIDLRHFTGSLQTFIERTHPDVVMVLYNPSESVGNQINWTSHKDLFDFR